MLAFIAAAAGPAVVVGFALSPSVMTSVSRGRATGSSRAGLSMMAAEGKQRVLVIGGTRFSGLYLTKELHSRGHEVRAVLLCLAVHGCTAVCVCVGTCVQSWVVSKFCSSKIQARQGLSQDTCVSRGDPKDVRMYSETERKRRNKTGLDYGILLALLKVGNSEHRKKECGQPSREE